MSSKRHLRRKRCEAKVRYATREDAERVNRHFPDAGTEVYRCGHCGHFHVGHRIGLNVEPRGFKGRMGRW